TSPWLTTNMKLRGSPLPKIVSPARKTSTACFWNMSNVGITNGFRRHVREPLHDESMSSVLQSRDRGRPTRGDDTRNARVSSSFSYEKAWQRVRESNPLLKLRAVA